MVTDQERITALEVVLRELAQAWHDMTLHYPEFESFEDCPFATCRKATVVIKEGVVLL